MPLLEPSMTRTIKTILPLALFLTGCFKTTVTGLASGGSPGAEQTVYNHTLVMGAFPLNHIAANDICGDAGVWSVSVKQSFVSVVASYFTAGIYVPIPVRITCRR